MEELTGLLVESVKGRDKGRRYVVIKDLDRYFSLVADGSKHTLESPKRKNRRHISRVPGTDKFPMDWTDDTLGDDRIRSFLKCHEKEV